MFQRRIGLVAVLLLQAQIGLAAELAQAEVLDGRVRMLVPTVLSLMPADTRRLKFPGDSGPALAYSNATGTVSIAVYYPGEKAPEADMPQVPAGLLEHVLTRRNPEMTWLRAETVDRNGRNVVLYDFRRSEGDTSIRTLSFGAILDGALLDIRFSCLAAEEGEWAAIGQRIIDSIEILN